MEYNKIEVNKINFYYKKYNKFDKQYYNLKIFLFIKYYLN